MRSEPLNKFLCHASYNNNNINGKDVLPRKNDDAKTMKAFMLLTSRIAFFFAFCFI